MMILQATSRKFKYCNLELEPPVTFIILFHLVAGNNINEVMWWNTIHSVADEAESAEQLWPKKPDQHA